MRLPELLAPAGNMNKLRVALAYGADAVYTGAAGFSLRPDSAALTLPELREAVDIVHTAGKKLYIALNIMLFNHELAAVERWLCQAAELNPDGLILGDAGILSIARRVAPQVPLHISTQMAVANYESAAFWGTIGAKRVILARECDLQMAAEIAKKCGVEIEIFVHGAMCMAVSGRCLLSAYLTGHSGSRGECKHACRWEYQLVEESRPGQTIPVFETGRETIFLGSRDLCLLEHIPALCASGVTSLKIEGRMKSEYYLATAVRSYRAALDAYAADPIGYSANPQWMGDICSASHRPFCTGFAFGYPHEDPAQAQCGNEYTYTHEYCGYLTDNGCLMVKNPFEPYEELEFFTPDGQAGLVRFGRILSPDGIEWPLARPGNEVHVDYTGERLPSWTMLRRPIKER